MRQPYAVDPDMALYHGDALAVLMELPDGAAEAVVTSPPYLDMRPEYPSPTLDGFEAIFRECRRVVTGGMLVNVGRFWRNRMEQLWWVGLIDRIISAGWPLVDTLIWSKLNANPIQGEILTNAHEYVFLFGDPDSFDPDAVRKPYAPGSEERLRRRWISSISVKSDGVERSGPRREQRRGERRDANPAGARASSVFECSTGKEKGNPHPAPMALDLAEHLVLLSGAKTILDPFAGSGNTGIAARKLERESILIELSESYCSLIAKRLGQQSLFA